VATDEHGRVLLAGELRVAMSRDRKRRLEKPRNWFVLMRLRPDGRVDRGFGPHGRIATRFGSLAVTGPSLLLDPEGRAIMVGTYGGRKGTEGLAVARYVFSR
jgi:hypothetical protein